MLDADDDRKWATRSVFAYTHRTHACTVHTSSVALPLLTVNKVAKESNVSHSIVVDCRRSSTYLILL